MKQFYVYPFLFKWDNIVPIDYPFIKIQGPGESMGCLIVFDDWQKYVDYCGEEYYSPLTVGEGVKDGKQQN